MQCLCYSNIASLQQVLIELAGDFDSCIIVGAPQGPDDMSEPSDLERNHPMVMVERVQVLLYSVRTTLASKVCDCTGLEWVKNILFLWPLKDVENGRLYQSTLDQYKARENFDIGGIDPKRGLTTLAIAALKGQTHVVRLLLYNRASACKLFRGDRGPLWFAAAGRMHRKDRSDIIPLLLDSKAEIDRPSPVNGNYTSLMKSSSNGRIRRSSVSWWTPVHL
ncbi:ankyrin-3 [Aspergillus udagawae]|nr:ankyrin-3 [Aspergillus udagawae]